MITFKTKTKSTPYRFYAPHVCNLPQASQSDSLLIEGIPLDGLWKGGGALM